MSYDLSPLFQVYVIVPAGTSNACLPFPIVALAEPPAAAIVALLIEPIVHVPYEVSPPLDIVLVI